MAIKYKFGNMFEEPAEAIVNTVNCVGVMGKGVALEFKKRWPKNYKAYRILCDKKLLSPGHMFVYENGDMFGSSTHKFLINFPTKQHWRSKSKLSFIDEGLDDFVAQIKKYKIKSVVIPPLGCGNGGLDWLSVKELLEKKLSQLDDVELIIFAPKEAITVPEHETVPVEMTTPRAALIKTLGEFEVYFGGSYTRLSLQKITYFLQVLGIDFGLKFSKEKYGPYSTKLHQAFRAMERSGYLQGYISNENIITTSGAYASAEEHINKVADTIHDVVEKLSRLIEGFESPFGLELLSSVYFIHKEKGTDDIDVIINEFSQWNDHKQDSFGRHEIQSAISRLREDGLFS